MNPLDLRVYIITASVPHLGRTHEDVALAALAGGARIIQFRDKEISDEEFAAIAQRLLQLTRKHNALLIINDRVEVALAIGADGVHVGQHDLAFAEVKRISCPGMIIGISATDYSEAISLASSGADYLGVGPIFPTPSKADATPPIGLDELARICRDIRIPIVAIGGITESNLPQIINIGVAGAAVISAISSAPDMTAATAALLGVWSKVGED
ncbi:MAG: thiamine phosphate synthase [Terriglobia bacterium]|jgi:thiamine-phosphate pyrophosphorylase|nr:thiamine phosphate synthase [Terriglobia bacterium]